MHTNQDKLLLKQEVFQIVACAIEVLIVFDTIVVDTKVIVGLILNFKHRKLDWERLVL